MPRTLVIIPALNEEDALPVVLRDLARSVPDHDVLVVDDGSVDGTADAARSGGARVAQLPFHLGIGGGLRTGFRYAVDQGYERAVQFDADGQHDPAEIASLFALLDSGSDLAIGSRFAASERSYRIGHVRSAAMRFLRLAFQVLSGQSFTDTSSGFRAFSRPMLEFFSHNYPVEYMDSVEALLLACYAGFTVTETKVTMRERQAGAPSTRSVRLIYSYLRLLIVMTSSASLRSRARRMAV